MALARPVEHWARIKETYLRLKSVRKTAAALRIGKTGVEYALHQMDVPMFPRNRTGDENSQRQNIDPDSPSGLVRNPSLMIGLYEVEHMSIPDIARAIGASRTAVITGLAQCGIVLRSKSDALRGKPRPSIRGARHYAWRGGSTSWRRCARHLLNSAWVFPVMKRDGFKCQFCGDTRNIEAHHVRRFSDIVRVVKQTHDETHVEVFVDAIVAEHCLEDGLTLCAKCHDKYHKDNP